MTTPIRIALAVGNVGAATALLRAGAQVQMGLHSLNVGGGSLPETSTNFLFLSSRSSVLHLAALYAAVNGLVGECQRPYEKFCCEVTDFSARHQWRAFWVACLCTVHRYGKFRKTKERAPFKKRMALAAHVSTLFGIRPLVHLIRSFVTRPSLVSTDLRDEHDRRASDIMRWKCLLDC